VVVVAWLRSSLPSEVPDESGTLADRREEALSVDLPCSRPTVIGYFDPEGRPVRGRARIVNHSLDGISLRDGRVFIAEVACPA
jgi:hypothetical protein